MTKKIALAAAVAAALTSGAASAELTANAGIFSNYIWRGVTQTNDQAAGQGGIDWGFGPGLYLGTWVSNVDFSGLGDGYEMDVYGGWAGEAGSFGYDLGFITYQYPVDPSNSNFTELYATGSIAGFTAGIWYTVDKASGLSDPRGDDDVYLFGAYDFTAMDIDYSLYIGNYSFDADSTADYTHYGASIGKNGFSFAVDKNDIEGGSADNVRFTVGYTVDFELM
jgi:uncharacterized protein (TIGR02001 family)